MNGHAEKYTKRLRCLYDNRGISVATFDCKYAHSCQQEEYRTLCRGAEAHVGELYGNPVRIVFVSHDTGADGRVCARGESLELRRNAVQLVRLSNGPNPHMRGTLLTLRAIFPSTPERDLLKKCALTNSAKCSGDSRGAVNIELYNNCRDHGLAELRALDPQLVISQGVRARHMLGPLQYLDENELSSFGLEEQETNEVRKYLRLWDNNGQGVNTIVVKAPHPSAPGPWATFRNKALRPVCDVVRIHLLTNLNE